MSEEKRAYSWQQFVDSGFDGREYKFLDEAGTFTATLACKRWNRHRNLIAYLDFDDGRKILTSAWQREQYHGLPELPIGSRVRVIFKESAGGTVYLRGVEKI